VRELAAQRITARIRNIAFDGNNWDDHVITEYYDPFLSYWIVADPTFGVVYWNPSTSTGMSVSDLSSAVANQNWSSITPFIMYVTTNGGIYTHNYYMDPILLYLNPSAPGNINPQTPLVNSPLPYLTAQSTPGTYGTWLFSFQIQTDTVTISDSRLGTFTLGPLNGTSYCQAEILSKGWSIRTAPSGLQMYTMNRYVYF
jgi:hypothetical protein